MIKHLTGRTDEELLAVKKTAREHINKVRMCISSNPKYILGGTYANSKSMIIYFRLKKSFSDPLNNKFSYEYHIYREFSCLRTPGFTYHIYREFSCLRTPGFTNHYNIRLISEIKKILE